MTDFQEDDDYTPLDAIEAKINEKLWDISDEFQKLNDLVNKFIALGIPADERRNLEDEIREAFGDRRRFSTLNISEAAYAARKAANAAPKPAAA